MAGIDLDADLYPGLFAAGWRIGTQLAQCGELLRVATQVEHRPNFPLRDAIDDNTGVLVVRNTWPLGSGNTAIFFGADVVRFDFNAAGDLFCIWAFEGYRGRAFGRVGIGSPLQEVLSQFPLLFDSGDEMYYPNWELDPHAPKGIAFVAHEDEEPGRMPVFGISIHNWDIMRRDC